MEIATRSLKTHQIESTELKPDSNGILIEGYLKPCRDDARDHVSQF